MKRLLHIYYICVFALTLAACTAESGTADSDLCELYTRLDAEIDRSHDYELVKERRIEQLREESLREEDPVRLARLYDRLIVEYEAYNADSAQSYVNAALQLAETADAPTRRTRLLIKRADIYAHAGLFHEALAIMQEIDRPTLADTLLTPYYNTYCDIYQYMAEYTDRHETAITYSELRALYADSLRRVSTPGDFCHMTYVVSEQARGGDTDTAIAKLTSYLDRYQSGSREYSILASTLAYICKTAGRDDDYRRYLVLSAISDVQGAVKENMSFREVATVMFENGDIDRANRYLKKSIADANFYSALMRNAQSSKMLPVIDDAYDREQESMHSRLRVMVWISSVLSVILLITILLILKQFKSVRRANARVETVNGELRELSGQLRQAVQELELRNGELRQFNHTKEQYAGLFMEYCSTAISTLQHFLQSLRVLTAKGGNRATLLARLESNDIVEPLLKNFYGKFDEAILSIYPDFAEKVNTLLRDEEKIVLKPGELLNTELRLLALVRIGIDDSAKIAEFLRCSLSTVYTYRSKLKRRALDPATFESDIMKIAR